MCLTAPHLGGFASSQLSRWCSLWLSSVISGVPLSFKRVALGHFRYNTAIHLGGFMLSHISHCCSMGWLCIIWPIVTYRCGFLSSHISYLCSLGWFYVVPFVSLPLSGLALFISRCPTDINLGGFASFQVSYVHTIQHWVNSASSQVF